MQILHPSEKSELDKTLCYNQKNIIFKFIPVIFQYTLVKVIGSAWLFLSQIYTFGLIQIIQTQITNVYNQIIYQMLHGLQFFTLTVFLKHASQIISYAYFSQNMRFKTIQSISQIFCQPSFPFQIPKSYSFQMKIMVCFRTAGRTGFWENDMLSSSQLRNGFIKKIKLTILQSYNFSLMGAQCVRYSPKIASPSQHHRLKESSRIRAQDQMLHFQINISDLELHCAANNIGKVVFTVMGYVNIQFSSHELLLLDKMIRCVSSKKAAFSVNSKSIEFLQFNVTIFDTRGSKIEKVCLKMHSVCEGPRHHDHLLKQMKARIIYNLEVSQLISAVFGCNDYRITDLKKNDLSQEYGLELDMLVPGQDDKESDEKKIFFSRNPEQAQKFMKSNITSKKLKQSLFRIIVFKVNSSGFRDFQEPSHQLCVPFMKFWTQDDMSMISQKNGQITFERVNLKYFQKIRLQNQNDLNVFLDLNLKTTKIYLQQIECMTFSESGIKTVSPSLLSPKSTKSSNNFLSIHQIQLYDKLFKKQKKVTYQSKSQIQKGIKQCYTYFNEAVINKTSSPNDLQNIQTLLLNILTSLGNLITEGEDVTNESIWAVVDKIIHRPQLSTGYFCMIKNPSQKTEIGLKFYGFIFNILSKIILCTTVGLTYHQLKCIQKFIGYVYFRCKWVQNLVIKSLKRQDDPQFTAQKLMEVGVYLSNKSPSKSLLYDWQQCLLPYVINEPRFRQLSNNLLQTSESVPRWAQLLFNRQDQDLYYGLLIQIWTQGQIFLDNQDKIMWEYFPNYAQLLSTFLGQMNRNKIMDYSYLFRQCSMKLISNQKLLNNFVMFLFPKTCLYEINCVIKCLQLIHSYFQVIEKKNKKMPSQFNFNYFYTGIKCIFQSNHSYLLIRVIGLLYDYYHILSFDFKRSLDIFIFSKGFNYIFLHWCDYARKMFYLFLQHRIAVKFREYQQNKNSQKNHNSFQLLQRKHQYENLIECIQNQQQQMLKMSVKKCENSQYYKRMKQRLAQKKLNKKNNSTKNVKSIDEGQFQTQQPTISRKQTMWTVNQTQLPRLNRKWSSDNYQMESTSILPEQLKKYIVCSMRDYRQLKSVQNPNEQVRKIMKIFEGGNKSIDN